MIAWLFHFKVTDRNFLLSKNANRLRLIRCLWQKSVLEQGYM